MTEQITQAETKANAKAQAAADKAYKKASRPWFKKKRFILPLIIVAIILITNIANAGKKDTGANAPAGSSPAASTAASEPAKPAAAAAFPGAKDSDTVGKAGDAIKIGEATVTSSPVANGNSTYSPTLCTSVSLTNGSTKTVRFNGFDWKFQSPSGTIVTQTFVGTNSPLSSGEIAPGGKASGDVCFDNKQEAGAGQYVVLYAPTFSDRAAWINNR